MSKLAIKQPFGENNPVTNAHKLQTFVSIPYITGELLQRFLANENARVRLARSVIQ
jgi:hypothetical protein